MNLLDYFTVDYPILTQSNMPSLLPFKRLVDTSVPYLRYEGWAPLDSAVTDSIWIIRELRLDGTLLTETFALQGKQEARWDQRSSYFPTPPDPGFTGTIVASGDSNTDPFSPGIGTAGSVQVIWTGLNATDATITVQTSNNATNYNDVTDFTLSPSASNQIVNFCTVTTNYIRLAYDNGSVTAGNISYIWAGE